MPPVAVSQTPPSNLDRERCSIVGALEAIGDTWSVLVLRQVFFGDFAVTSDLDFGSKPECGFSGA